ncbi:MAG TPA: DUF3798 domain-containing protein [Bacillota bacterium]|jgi:hypothetical protein|nr:DUF3798 domain-containing protein [Fastidiosipila sp.]HPX93413.1 DUF3798 domain-containing protein [Bacillota bacterium]HQB81185.1 DUF3798 domain-containing protein [Bacillota bacterium]
MTKKILVALLAVMLILSVVACDRGEKPPAGGDYKIGVYTGTVSQGEEEYQAGQKMKERYGDKIITGTYPDNFSSEVEQVIQGVLQLASDEKVKAIVFVQAIPGAAAAIDKVRETRPDMLFVAGVCAEPPEVMAAKADVNLLVDEISMGHTIPEEAHRMGAKTFVHISFPRHLGYETIATRRQIMIETCKDLGITFMDLEAPDPTGDAGISGAQQFIREDIPKKIAELGPDTAFFSTNCGLQEPLIQEVLKGGAIYPQQCCPSPYHAYPAALGVDLEGHEGDVKFMLQSIRDKLLEAGQEKRMSTWGVPINMLMLEAGVEYAIEFCEGKFTERHDRPALERAIKKVADEYKAGTIQISNFKTEDGKELDNFYMLLAPFVDFSKPIE